MHYYRTMSRPHNAVLHSITSQLALLPPPKTLLELKPQRQLVEPAVRCPGSSSRVCPDKRDTSQRLQIAERLLLQGWIVGRRPLSDSPSVPASQTYAPLAIQMSPKNLRRLRRCVRPTRACFLRTVVIGLARASGTLCCNETYEDACTLRAVLVVQCVRQCRGRDLVSNTLCRYSKHQAKVIRHKLLTSYRYHGMTGVARRPMIPALSTTS